MPRDLRLCDLTFWVYCTISSLIQKCIIELRNTLSEIDSQDTAPGILKFSDLLNLSIKKSRSYMTWAVRDRVKKHLSIDMDVDPCKFSETFATTATC